MTATPPISIEVSGHTIGYKSLGFSGGEVHVRLSSVPPSWSTATITAHLRDSASVMELLIATDALQRAGDGPIHLVCPYLPYARQDRVCHPGEALSLKVMAGLINAQGYASIEVWDVHSDTALALLDRPKHVSALEFLHAAADGDDALVAPDAGASKRVFEFARALGLPVVQAEKHRSTDTGEITGTRVHSDHMGERNFLIVDDICDGGRTFVELAKALRPLTNGQIKLYVTHGIFSAGFDRLADVIDQIYVANCFPETFPIDLVAVCS